MGRKCDFISRKFFKFEKERNLSVCKICQRVLKGNYLTNLKRHMHEEHKFELEEETGK